MGGLFGLRVALAGPPQPLDDVLHGRRAGSAGAVALHRVEREGVTVATQRIELRDVEQEVPLPARCARLQRQRQAEVVEEVDEHRLARSDATLALELAIHARERDRVIHSVMRPARVDTEPLRQMLELGAVA